MQLTIGSAMNMQNQSISRIQILDGGQGYVAGDFNITRIKSHGQDFTLNPSAYDVYYAGTSVKQVWSNKSE
jgi:hypothetical protein